MADLLLAILFVPLGLLALGELYLLLEGEKADD
jgi:hypothetical protein